MNRAQTDAERVYQRLSFDPVPRTALGGIPILDVGLRHLQHEDQ
jgi:hypothetical protein